MSETHSRCPAFPFKRTHTFNPPPENSQLRSQDPVTQVKLFDGSSAWILTRHSDCCEALSSSKLSADRRHNGYPEIHAGGQKAKEARPTFVNLDDPEHRKQRDMLQAAFEPAAVEKLRPMMAATVDRNLDRLIQEGEKSKSVDLMEYFATPVPTQIVFKLLGVPDEDIENLSKDSEVRHSTSRNAAESSNKDLQSRMTQLVEKRIREPQDDLISKLIVEQYQTGHLAKEDVIQLAFLVLTAGNAALLSAIGLGVITLLTHPDQLAEFKKDPSLAPQVVNELLRYNTTSALNSRRATRDTIRIRNHDLPKDVGIICSVQAADRDRLDPNESDPETFDIHRNRDPHQVLGFGYGPHRCQGEAFSRVQLEIALTKLFQRLPDLRLVKDPEDLQYSPAEQNASVVALPVVF